MPCGEALRSDGRLINRTGSTLPAAILTSVKRSADRAGLTGCTARVMTPQNGIEPAEALLFQDHTTSRPEHPFRAAIGFQPGHPTARTQRQSLYSHSRRFRAGWSDMTRLAPRSVGRA